MSELITRKDVAVKFSVSTETVRRWERSGVLPIATKIMGKPRYDKTQIEELLKKGINKNAK